MTKTLLSVFLLSFLFLGCQNGKKSTDKQEPETAQASWRAQMQLEKGQKWRANRETVDGVRKMQSLLKNNPKKTLDDYHTLGKHLVDVQNFIIRKCTMKGDSHKNLHTWLEPLITNIKSLTSAKSEQDAEKITRKIERQLDGFFDYFR